SAQTTPGMIVSNNGTELTSNAVLSWCGEIGAEWHYIAPGKPMQNGYVERLASPPFGSTAACATSFSMRRSSSAWITLAPRSSRGWRTTTASDRTRPLDTKPRWRSPPNCKSNGLLRSALRAPLRSPSLQPRSCAKQPPGSNPSRRKAGGQVMIILLCRHLLGGGVKGFAKNADGAATI